MNNTCSTVLHICMYNNSSTLVVLRALRPSKYHRCHCPTNLTHLEHGNSYKKDVNHNRKQQNDDGFWQPVHWLGVVEYRRKLRSRESSNDKPLCLNLLKAILLLVLDVKKCSWPTTPTKHNSGRKHYLNLICLQSQHIPQPMNINKGSPHSFGRPCPALIGGATSRVDCVMEKAAEKLPAKEHSDCIVVGRP